MSSEMKPCLGYVYSVKSQAIQGPAGPGPEKPPSPSQDWAYPLPYIIKHNLLFYHILVFFIKIACLFKNIFVYFIGKNIFVNKIHDA